MDAVTYPDDRVVEFINQNMVPVRVPSNAEPISTKFEVKWTPALVTLDEDAKEHHRTVGWLAPEELIPSLMLGIAKSCFDRGQFGKAIAVLDKMMSQYPASEAAPEALFLRGVSGYKESGDPGALKEAQKQLQQKYPSSGWAKRASVYRLL